MPLQLQICSQHVLFSSSVAYISPSLVGDGSPYTVAGCPCEPRTLCSQTTARRSSSSSRRTPEIDRKNRLACPRVGVIYRLAEVPFAFYLCLQASASYRPRSLIGPLRVQASILSGPVSYWPPIGLRFSCAPAYGPTRHPSVGPPTSPSAVPPVGKGKFSALLPRYN